MNTTEATSPQHGTDAQQGTDARDATAAQVYAVMRRLVLDEDDHRNEVADTLGMSFIRTKALRRLVDGSLRMSELTAKLATDKPYTTVIVDDLERRGLVVRSVHPDDRRCKIVTITEAGRQAADQAEAILSRPPRALLGLGDAKLAELKRLLGSL